MHPHRWNTEHSLKVPIELPQFKVQSRRGKKQRKILYRISLSTLVIEGSKTSNEVE